MAGTAAYVNSFDGEFVYDDLGSIRENPHIRTLWPLSEAMSLPLSQTGETVARRPLLSLSFALNHALLGPRLWGYHLVNLAIHLAAGLLLFGIVRRTLDREPFRGRYGRSSVALALAVTLLWIVHPLHTESVTYIVQRAESLMGMLYLLALYCSLRGFESRRSGLWYFAAAGACAAGMAVKEVMVTAPLVIFLYDGIFVSRSYRSAWRQRRGLYAALAATWAVLIGVQCLGLAGVRDDFTSRSILSYALSQPGVILYYLRLSAWPDPLVLDYAWSTDAGAAEIVPAAAVVALLLGVTCWGLFRRRWYGFVGAWFFLILGPTSSFVALMQPMVEHRMYLPLAAVSVLIVVAADAMLRRLLPAPPSRRLAGAALLVVVAAALGWRTHVRNDDYHDAVDLWTDNIAHRPESARAHNNLGNAYFEYRQFARAAACYRRAAAISPQNYLFRTNLGIAAAERGNWRDAITQYRHALHLRPDNPSAHYYLGVAFSAEGMPRRAIRHYCRALALKPNYAQAYVNLGKARFRQGNREAAIFHLRRAVAIEPEYAGAHLSLGVALAAHGETGRAIDHFQKAVAIDDNLWQAHLALGAWYLEQGSRQEAVEHLQRAVRQQPQSLEARELLRRAENGRRSGVGPSGPSRTGRRPGATTTPLGT